MIRLLAFYCVCLGYIHLARAQSTACATPHGERGNCIPLQQCPSLANSNRYQLYQCGNTNNPRNPFVCCADTSQPSGNQRPSHQQPSPYDQPNYNSNYNRPTYDQTTTDRYRPSTSPSSLSYDPYRPSSGQFGGGQFNGGSQFNGGGQFNNGQNRPPYNEYRPSSSNYDQNNQYRPTSGQSNNDYNRPSYDQSPYRPSSSSDHSFPSSQHRPSYDQTTYRPSSSHRPGYRQRFTESDLPQTGRCGTQARERIVGGEDTSIRDYPWMTLIHYSKRGSGGGFFCGGALIHENYVITAAHCIRGTSLVKAGYAPDSVRLGEHDLNSSTDCEEGECADPVENIDVADTIVHDQYDADEDSQSHDIALIRLARPAPYTDYIRPICLPIARHLRNKNFDNQPLIVAGFGKTEHASRSDKKLQLQINGVNLDSCDNTYQRYLGLKLTRNQLCAGGEEGKDSCSGDSGGPLMGEDRSNSYNPYMYLAGVVSLGPTKCGTAGYPGVYTRTDQYIEWILNHMEK